MTATSTDRRLEETTNQEPQTPVDRHTDALLELIRSFRDARTDQSNKIYYAVWNYVNSKGVQGECASHMGEIRLAVTPALEELCQPAADGNGTPVLDAATCQDILTELLTEPQ